MTYRTFTALSIANAVAIGVIFLAWTWPAWSHTAPEGWSYPMICCSNRDCRPVKDGEVRETKEGYLLVSTGEVVPYGNHRVKPISQDGEIHVCQQGGNFDSGRILCLIIPPPAF